MSTCVPSSTTLRHPTRHRQRIPLLGPLLVLAVFASAFLVPTIQPTQVAYRPWCLVDTNVPDAAYAVEEFVRTHNYSPPPGLAGGRAFADDNHLLPALLRPYKEYDVYPSVPGRGRRPERVVLSARLPYASWYTSNHYGNLLLMFPVTCVMTSGRGLPGPGGD